MSPVREENQQPPSTSYGQGVAEQQFTEATAPVESPVATPAEPVAEPVTPQAFQPGEEKFQPPPEDLVAGQPLAADAATALFQPAGVTEDGADLGRWLPVLEEIAAIPGSSPVLKALARRGRQLLEEDA